MNKIKELDKTNIVLQQQNMDLREFIKKIEKRELAYDTDLNNIDQSFKSGSKLLDEFNFYKQNFQSLFVMMKYHFEDNLIFENKFNIIKDKISAIFVESNAKNLIDDEI